MTTLNSARMQQQSLYHYQWIPSNTVPPTAVEMVAYVGICLLSVVGLGLLGLVLV